MRNNVKVNSFQFVQLDKVLPKNNLAEQLFC